MQSLFRLPWSHDPIGDMSAGKTDPLFKLRQTPPTIKLVASKLKRKRSTTSTAPLSPAPREQKRWKGDEPGNDGHSAVKLQEAERAATGVSRLTKTTTSAAASSTSIAKNAADDQHGHVIPAAGSRTEQAPIAVSDTTPSTAMSDMQQLIDHHFSVEILTKHRELRLIDQEIAKCQIALEQLRRCEVIAFPVTQSMSEDVASGQGAALKAAEGFSQPQHPPPFGVVDGPYTRHYARWLLPDVKFDTMDLTMLATAQDDLAARRDGRATRHSISTAVKPSKTRFARDSLSQLPLERPSYPAANVRGKQGPLVLRRNADNQLVKLVCNHCHRSDFSSVQGFLNHCRIAHKLDYKSHEAAAIDCGQLLDADESELAMTTALPTAPAVRAPTARANTNTVATTRVHPLNSATIPRFTWKHQRLSWERAQASTAVTPRRVAQAAEPSAAARAFNAAPFKAAAHAPHLSARFASRKMGGDLAAIVSQAQEKVKIEHEDAMPEDQAEATELETGLVALARLNQDAERPASRKGHRHPIRPRPAPLSPYMGHATSACDIDQLRDEHDLSPHAVDSNPGLISDHDDDPTSDVEEDVSNDVTPNHHLGMGRDCSANELAVALEVEDDHDGHGVLVRPQSLHVRSHDSRRDDNPARSRSRYVDVAK